MANFMAGVPVTKEARGTRGWLQYQSGGGGISPHTSFTIRDTFTVPAGKILRVDHIIIEMVRTEVANTPGEGQLSLYAIGTSRNIVKTKLRITKNNIGDDLVVIHSPSNVFVDENEDISLGTYDRSTGGKIAYYAHVWYTLFDK